MYIRKLKNIFAENIYHTIGFGYSLKDYQVTNQSTATNSIKNSEGGSISFNISKSLSHIKSNSSLNFFC